MKVGRVLDEVGDVEHELAQHLLRFGERHAAEHDLYHTARRLARQCAQHLEQLEPFAERYGSDRPETDVKDPGVLERLRRAASDAVGRSESAAFVVLRDLRDLYVSVQDAELMWVVLLQTAQAARDGELVRVAVDCHEHAEMRGKWIRTRVKETAPQLYVT